jgi:hypothetical protein
VDETMEPDDSLEALSGPVLEYACQEGNYGLPGILAGARAEEKAAQRVQTTIQP